MAQTLSDLSLTALRRMLRATERADGKDSVGAQIIRRAIQTKRAPRKRSALRILRISKGELKERE